MNLQSMKTDSTTRKTPLAKQISGYKAGIIRWIGQMTFALVFFGTVLFLSAGTSSWRNGWIYLGMNALTQVLSALVLIPRQPDMLDERSKVREGTKGYDRILAPAIVIFGTLAVLITAGLDARFGWSGTLNGWLLGAGVTLAFLSQLFVLWAMASNPFFALTVRIQDDRGHTVINNGPYQLVRHPGYAGSLLYNLAIPLVLNSWWTYIPAILTAVLILVRTGLEDRTLLEELPEYRAFATKVRCRLLPGIW
jgi:protein-S-isoprenylcysteine O-methyltransferase Ste14